MSTQTKPERKDDQQPDPDATTPAEERGERIETGRRIARGGKDEGEVPGATGDDADDPRAGRDNSKATDS
jgi:hypothetical protein